MIDPKLFDDLARRLAESVPGGLRQMQIDMEKNFRAVLQTAFSRMDLVTREEFEVQRQLLQRARIQLDDLERRLDQQARQDAAQHDRSAAANTPDS